MGYRSDVVAVFYAQDRSEEKYKKRNERNRAKLKLFVEANFPESLREDDDDGGLNVFDTPTRLLYEFKHTDVKWYDSYPEVIAFEQFWDSFGNLCDKHNPSAPAEDADTEGVDWAAEFIRLGENADDIEERSLGEADWLLRVSRTIETDY